VIARGFALATVVDLTRDLLRPRAILALAFIWWERLPDAKKLRVADRSWGLRGKRCAT
jgi:hypothetical protein